jgi:hypothetical protein
MSQRLPHLTDRKVEAAMYAFRRTLLWSSVDQIRANRVCLPVTATIPIRPGRARSVPCTPLGD